MAKPNQMQLHYMTNNPDNLSIDEMMKVTGLSKKTVEAHININKKEEISVAELVQEEVRRQLEEKNKPTLPAATNISNDMGRVKNKDGTEIRASIMTPNASMKSDIIAKNRISLRDMDTFVHKPRG